LGNSWVNTVPFLYGAGGGYTALDGIATFDRPSYQDGVVPSNTVGRAVPDISADADPTTGMLVGETQDFTLPSRFGPAGVHYGEYRIGGTSLASPLIAGMQAVAQGHSRIGFANPLIYSLARSGVYYDVTPQGDAGNVRSDFANSQNADDGLAYSVRTFDQDSSLTTGPGWDDVSGVGSPTAAYFGVFQNKFH
jgi:subtilase family serine protease